MRARGDRSPPAESASEARRASAPAAAQSPYRAHRRGAPMGPPDPRLTTSKRNPAPRQFPVGRLNLERAHRAFRPPGWGNLRSQIALPPRNDPTINALDGRGYSERQGRASITPQANMPARSA